MSSASGFPKQKKQQSHNGFEKWILDNRNFNPYLFFLLLCLLKAGTIFLQEDLLGYRADFFVDISGIGDPQASAMMSLMWSIKIGLGYFSIPFYYLMKFSVVGLVLWLGSFGFGYRIGYRFLFKLAMVAQLAFFIPDFFKILYFGIFSPQYGMEEFNAFQPLSMMSLIDVEESSAMMINLAEWLSLAQVFYMYLLAVGIRLKYDRTLKQALSLVSASYVPASLFWIFFYSIVFA